MKLMMMMMMMELSQTTVTSIAKRLLTDLLRAVFKQSVQSTIK